MLGFISGRSKLSNALSIVELLVHMDCEGCKKRIRRAISKLEGVDGLEIDMDKQKVTVKGYVDERKVLKIVRTGRKAEFWPFPYDSEYYPYASQYLDETNYASSYNYYKHGYNESVHGYFPDQAYSTVDDETVHLFSEDNVHAYCTIIDEATFFFKQISEAHDVLSDDRKRADYDFGSSSSSSFNRRYSHQPSGGGSGYGGYYTHSASNSRSYSYRPSGSVLVESVLRYLSTRAFLLNAGFACVILGGFVVVDIGKEALWKTLNSGKSFEEAMDSISKAKSQRDEA